MIDARKPRNRRPPSPNRRVVSIPEAGDILGVSREHAYKAAKSGEIPTIRIGRRLLVPMAALERMLGHEIYPDIDFLGQPK